MDPARSVAVVLLGAPGSGKTTLAAALLGAPAVTAGPGRLGAGSVEVEGVRVWLLDPPGAPQLAGEWHAGLRGADLAVLVVSPVQGLDPLSVARWESVEHLPRLVVLTQLDRPGADADEAVAVCQRLLGETVLPLQLPLHDDDGSVGGVLDLLSLTVCEPGSPARPAEPEHLPLVAGLRADLLDAVLTGSEDEQLFADWLGDVEPPPAALAPELRAAVGRGDLQPVVVASPRRVVGVAELRALLAGLPAPGAAPAATRRDGSPVDSDALVAEVLSPGLLKVWSGTLPHGSAVLVDGVPGRYDGPPARAGDLLRWPDAAVPARSVLTSPGPAGPGQQTRDVVQLAPWSAPEPRFPVGVQPSDALAARVRADPVARLAQDARTGQLLLWTYGPEHAELLLDGAQAAPVLVPAGGRPVPVTVSVPAWCERAVVSDLRSRGEVRSVDATDDPVVVRAALPPRELAGYALVLGRLSAWTATLTRP